MKTVSQVKTRQEMAAEYGVSRKTFYRWLKKKSINLENGLVSPKDQESIYTTFGNPKVKKRRWI